MPSKTQKQHNLMEMVAHGGKPTKVKGGGPPKAVAEEFVQADKGKKMPTDAMAKAMRKKPGY